jgi:hypothetical protein
VEETGASTVQILGAGGFGTLLGWYIYYLVRHRTDRIGIGDLGTIAGVVGGAAILTLFPAKTDLFGAYGIGLFVGFFGYFSLLLVFVASSRRFGVEWFLDGRRKSIDTSTETDSGNIPMGGA